MERMIRFALSFGCLAAASATSFGQPAEHKAHASDEVCVIWPVYNYGSSTLFYCDLYPNSSCPNPQAQYELLDSTTPYPCDCANGPLAQAPPDCCGEPGMRDGRDRHGFGGLRQYFISSRDFAQQPDAKYVHKHLNSYEEVVSIDGYKYLLILARTPNRDVPAMMYRFEFSIEGHTPPSIASRKTIFIAFEWRGSGGTSVDGLTKLDDNNPHAFRGTYNHNGQDFPLLVLTK